MHEREVTKIAEQKMTAKKKGFDLNIKALQKVLKNPDCCDLPVVVICIAGPCRTGKSFFLNLFLHYVLNYKVRHNL